MPFVPQNNGLIDSYHTKSTNVGGSVLPEPRSLPHFLTSSLTSSLPHFLPPSLTHSGFESLIWPTGDSALLQIKCNKFTLSTAGHSQSLTYSLSTHTHTHTNTHLNALRRISSRLFLDRRLAYTKKSFPVLILRSRSSASHTLASPPPPLSSLASTPFQRLHPSHISILRIWPFPACLSPVTSNQPHPVTAQLTCMFPSLALASSSSLLLHVSPWGSECS